MNLDIYRNGIVIEQIPVNDSMLFSRTLMQEHKITVPSFTSPFPLNVQLNDYIVFNNVRYTVNTVPNIAITNVLVYSIVFEGPEYRLYDKIMFHQGNADFPYFGTAREQLLVLLENINSIDPGWTLGVIDETQPDFVDYINFSCRVALGTIADVFKLEYYFNNKEISMVKQAGNVTTHTFEYGMGNGLYSLTRTYVSEMNIKTKVYGFGSTRNLPAGYRGGLTRLTFADKFITRNVDIYGLKEAQFTDEEIYPNREGVISAVSTITDDSTTFTITDSTLDFNINNLKLGGVEAKVSFITGELTGETFVITGYNDATKVITLKTQTNSSNIKLPSASIQPAIGDKYGFLDITLPQSYIDAAEAKVRAGTVTYTDQNAVPRVEYALDIDIMHVRDNGINLTPGDIVTVINTSLGINDQIRVTSISFPISFPETLTTNTKYSATIANFVPYTVQKRESKDILTNKQEIKLVDRRSIELARRNTNNFRDLQDLIYDPDGYFDTGNIKPGSIETLMLSVGAKSQNFRLNGVVFTMNYNGDPNSLNISNGVLEHLEIQITGLGNSWVIPTATFLGMDPLKPYYLYAKCSTAALTGVWQLSETPVFTEETPGYYNFNVGIIYRVKDGYRDQDFTYGLTSIVGDNLTTGRIKDITGVNYIDLRTKQFNLGDNTSGLDYNVSAPDTLTIKGEIIATNAQFINLIVQNLRTKLTGKRIEIIEADNNIRIYDVDNNILIELDDDSAFEKYTITPNDPPLPPTVTKVFGPGIRVGRVDGTGYGSLGRIGLTTDGNIIVYKKNSTDTVFSLSSDFERLTIDADTTINKDTLITEKLTVTKDVQFDGPIKPTAGTAGISYSADVRIGGTDFVRMVWNKGILVSQTLNP